MTNDLENFFRQVIDEQEFIFGIIASSSGEEILRYGDIDALQWKDLVKSLFGDVDAIVRLNKSLEGQILPQVYSQGDVRCAILKPKEELLIGLFDQSGKDTATFYKECREISKKLTNLG